jgi:hypothetical protein
MEPLHLTAHMLETAQSVHQTLNLVNASVKRYLLVAEVWTARQMNRWHNRAIAGMPFNGTTTTSRHMQPRLFSMSA